MRKGRPVKSEIRQNMVEILFFLGEAYGYKLFKVYQEVYPPVTLRSMYYHLKKGASLGEFKLIRIDKDKGDYSWGSSAQRIIYSLGPNAEPKGDPRVEDYLIKNS